MPQAADIIANARQFLFVREAQSLGQNRGQRVEWSSAFSNATTFFVASLGCARACEAVPGWKCADLRLVSKVRSLKRVTIDAVRLAGVVANKILAAERVGFVIHRLKMRGINARPIAAQMINLEAVRYITNEAPVNVPIGTVVPGPCISFFVDRPRPRPALGRSLSRLFEAFPRQKAVPHAA